MLRGWGGSGKVMPLLGLLHVAELLFKQSQVVEGNGVVGVEFHGLLVVGNGAVDVLEGTFEVGPTRIAVAVIGLELYGVIQVRQGIAFAALVEVTHRPVVEDVGVVGRFGQRFVVPFGGFEQLLCGHGLFGLRLIFVRNSAHDGQK